MMERRSSRTYKKYTMLLLIVAVTALVICTAAFALKRDTVLPADAAIQPRESSEQVYNSHYSPKPAASQENGNTGISSTPAKTDTKESEYLVSVSDGKIAVFRKGGLTPVLLTEIDIAQLPEEDISLLKQGIAAHTLSEAKTILEDYE